MKPTRLLQLGFAIAGMFAGPILMRADTAPADDRMRSELKDATLQLRAAQSDLSAAQAAQAATAADRDTIAAKYEGLKKQAAAQQAAAAKYAADLQSQLDALKSDNMELGDKLFTTKSAVVDASRDSQDAQARNARMKSEIIILNRKVADLESKNLALFLTANEILTHLQEFGLGTALSAKEPFVGSTRTKLENLIQDYQDKLSDQRARN